MNKSTLNNYIRDFIVAPSRAMRARLTKVHHPHNRSPVPSPREKIRVSNIHRAGKPTKRHQQYCVRCDMLLVDNSCATVPDAHTPRFFAEGALVEKFPNGAGGISLDVCDVTYCVPILLN